MLTPSDFFDLEDFEFKAVFDDCEFVWDALMKTGRFALEYIMNIKEESTIFGTVLKGAYIDDSDAIVIGEGTVVEPGAFIQGPAIIGKNCQIRHGAYIRGDVIIGNNCIIGHTSELKNSIMLDKAQCPHFAYVGDSILGREVNLGAGTKLSNVQVVSVKDKITHKRPTIKITINGIEYDTKLQKFGAVIGDRSQTGCNTVTNPGCLIGKDTLIYPNVSLRKGYYPDKKIIKLTQQITMVDRKL
ncbi:MAG: glucose-1-phosphate thymidylyltransferase [Armatimonadota bacterium]